MAEGHSECQAAFVLKIKKKKAVHKNKVKQKTWGQQSLAESKNASPLTGVIVNSFKCCSTTEWHQETYKRWQEQFETGSSGSKNSEKKLLITNKQRAASLRVAKDHKD